VVTIRTDGVGGSKGTLVPKPRPIPERSIRQEGIDGFFALLEDLAENDPKSFDRRFIDRLGTSLIVLATIVAVLLQMLCWKPRDVAHLVFSLYLHSFSCMILIAGAFTDGGISLVGAGREGIGNSIATIGILVYTLLALHRVHGEGQLRTLVKLTVLAFGYAVALVLTMMGSPVAAIATL
jgi:hypothetical protein